MLMDWCAFCSGLHNDTVEGSDLDVANTHAKGAAEADG